MVPRCYQSACIDCGHAVSPPHTRIPSPGWNFRNGHRFATRLRRRRRSHVTFSETGQRQRVASRLRARPVKGAPNVVGTPAIVGIPLWVVAHVAVLGDVARDAGALERGLVPRGVSELVTGADGFGLSATDGGLMPPLPSSVEPSGIPARPTDEPGPIDEAAGAGAVADAAQAPGALAAIPPPSKSEGLDSSGIELPMLADAPVIGLPTPADAGADEAPAHAAP